MKLVKWMILPILVLCAGVYAYTEQTQSIKLADLKGNVHDLADYRGQWLVVNYWATWCPACIEELPELMQFHDDNSHRDVMVLGVNYEKASVSDVNEFLQEYMISYPMLKDNPDGKNTVAPVRGLPTTFIIAPNGEVVHTKEGAVDAEYLEAVLREQREQMSVHDLYG